MWLSAPERQKDKKDWSVIYHYTINYIKIRIITNDSVLDQVKTLSQVGTSSYMAYAIMEQTQCVTEVQRDSISRQP